MVSLPRAKRRVRGAPRIPVVVLVGLRRWLELHTHDSTLRSYKKSAIRIYVPISLLYDLENLVRKTKAPGSVNGCANKSLKRMSHRLCMMSHTINIHSYPLNITN